MKIAQVVKHEIPILEDARACGFTPRKVGAGEYTLEEHDSIRIDAENNLFYRHSTGQGGSIIDFAMMIDQSDQHHALSRLREYLLSRKPYLSQQFARPRAAPQPPPEKVPLQLPEAAHGKFNRVFAYLSKTRGIDPGIVSEMIRRNQLYEDYRHNCVFVGYDRDNKPGYASIRGTLTDKGYKGEAHGSSKDVGWFVDNRSASLFVSEAAIDAMSLMTLLKRNGRDWTKYSYLSLGGTSSRALLHHLEGSPVRRIYLALDNDPAGLLGREHIRAALEKAGFQGRIEDKLPYYKDFNEDLQHILAGETLRRPDRAKENPLKVERSQ